MRSYSPRQERRALAKFTTQQRLLVVAPGLDLQLLEIVDPYSLLDRMVEQEAQNKRVERYPYWAELWPTSFGLAHWFCRTGVAPPGGWTRELGCGLGLVGISLALLGWRVEASDFIEDALIFAHCNARRNGVAHRHRVSYLDWRNPVGAPGSCMVASDVVYEKQNHPYLRRLLRDLLEPGGTFYLGDPGRPLAAPFIGDLQRLGYDHRAEQCTFDWQGRSTTIDIHILQKP
ncbi:MAG: hypothetical protein GKR89_09170 [Candidatus Latescibacteria bacterium]|nr:hypothetical protein [Candidatus Latescibacterota bacterium]